MARPIQKYFQFIVIGWVYQFSLAASFWESTKAVRCPQGVNLHVYLDYWLICASSPVQANLVLRVLQHLGWVIHFSKSDLPPGQQFNFICMQFSMCTYTVTPLPKMGIKIQNTLHHWKSHTLASPPGISTDFWACWPLWSPQCQEVSFASAQSNDGHQRPGVRRQGPGQTGFQWLRPFSQVAGWTSPAVLHGVSPSALQTEITLFTDASRHRWRHSWAPISCKGCGPGSRQASTSIWDGGSSAPECSRVPASSQVSYSVPDVRQRRGCVVHNQGRRFLHPVFSWGTPVINLFATLRTGSCLSRISWLSISYHVLFYWLRTRWSGSPVDTYFRHRSSQLGWAGENVVLEKWCEYIT